MPRLLPALAALLVGLARPAAAAPAAPPAQGPAPVPVLHLSVGTGVCATAHTDLSRTDNPCWLQLGAAPGVRLGALELGLIYEGRDLLKAVTFLLVRPPSATVLGATAGWVREQGERWRLAAAGEAGWRRYMDFAGEGLSQRKGAADTIFVGATGRAALGLRAGRGRVDRLEASLSLRSDLGRARATVDGVPWSARGWSLTLGVGLVTEW